jgi:Protein of unknown function (DUF2934)
MSNKPWVVHLSSEEKLLREETIRQNASQKWTEAGCPPGRYAGFWLRAEEEHDWPLFRQWQDKPFAFLTGPPVQVHQPTAAWDYNVHGIANPHVPASNARRIPTLPQADQPLLEGPPQRAPAPPSLDPPLTLP